MRARRLGLAAALGLALAANVGAAHADNWWRELLLAQVAATLDDPTPENVRDELSELLGVV